MARQMCIRDSVFDRAADAACLRCKRRDECWVKGYMETLDALNPLKAAAVKASLLAIVLILLYITFRFEFRSGLAAVITLCHDICVMMALFAIFQLPVNMNFIAAALTILGYSINATIVVFDRVRENSKSISDIKIFGDVTDRSIRQTLSRSINTSITTLIPILLILILGVPSIQNFAIALVIGILSGTYSSVFISGPLWVNLKKIGKKSAAKA